MAGIKASVGIHGGKQCYNVVDDQKVVIGLLNSIPAASGGTKGSPLSTPPQWGVCSPQLQRAITAFQTRNRLSADGHVDPGGGTIAKLNQLAAPNGPIGPDGPPIPGETPVPTPVVVTPRVPGTWQIANVSSVSVGEIGQVGGCNVTVTQPDNKQFVIKGAGAGFGIGLDPVSFYKWLENIKEPAAELAAAALAKMLASNLGWNIGDVLQMIGINLPSVSKGVIFPNQFNWLLGNSAQVTRYMIAGGSRPPFMVISGGGGVLVGGEAGGIAFGFGTNKQLIGALSAPAMGFYGSFGVGLKLSVGVQAMIYNVYDVEDVP